MPAERFFTDRIVPEKSEIIVKGEEFHHIRVMRTKVGDVIEFVDGCGHLATAILVSLEKDQAIFTVNHITSENPPQRQLVLVQAMPKLNRLEFIAEKGTELGMTALWLFPGDQSEKEGLSVNQTERIRSILVASMKQCGSLFLPILELKPKLSAWKNFPQKSYFGDVRSEAPQFIDEVDKSHDMFFFVGPESGFSKKEEDILNSSDVKGVHLHKNILRTDTAGIVALTIASQSRVK